LNRPQGKEGIMGNNGKSGCGCLLFILVVCMVLVGAFMHPFTLKLIAKQMRYEDKIVRADIVFVPRFVEDHEGELYVGAFHEYRTGNCRMIYIEEDKTFGVSIGVLIAKMAAIRGIKESIVKTIDAEGEGASKVNKISEQIQAMGYKKVIVLVPEYASKRFRLLYDSIQKEGGTLYMIKPVEMTYFVNDKWWKDRTSRFILLKEIYERGTNYFSSFKDEEKTENKK
jgi:hypothetical protein